MIYGSKHFHPEDSLVLIQINSFLLCWTRLYKGVDDESSLAISVIFSDEFCLNFFEFDSCQRLGTVCDPNRN
jgi:hypothetical protein